MKDADKSKSQPANSEKYKLTEETYRLLAEHSSDIFYRLNIENERYTYVSPSARKVLGYSAEEALTFTPRDVLTPESYQLQKQEMLRAIERGVSSQTLELEAIHKNGWIIPVEVNAFFINDQKGTPVEIAGIVRDISQHKQAEEALSEKSKEYETVFNGSQSAMFLVEVANGNTFRYIRNNYAHQVATGISFEELRGKTPQELLGDETGRQIALNYKSCIEAGKPVSYEETLTLPGGNKTWYTQLTPVYNQHNQVVHIVGSSEDITKRKKAEEALKHAAEEWRNTFDSIADMLAIIDADRKIIRVNKAFADTFNLKPKDFIGRTCYQVVHNLDQPHPSCIFECSLTTGKAYRYEMYEPRLSKHVECTLSPLINKNNNASRVVHIFKDITQRKTMEAEKQALRDKAEISSRLATVGEMAAGIAHEINNPLTSVLGFSELLSQEDLPSETKEKIDYIVDGSKRVKEIVKRMLTFARQTNPQRTIVDIAELIDNTLEMRGYVHKTANIEIIKQYDTNLPRLTVDPGQIQQVFINLIVNAEHAIKKAHGNGRLTITTNTVNDSVIISFKDNGKGMSKEILSKLFNPFFTTKEPGEGTGLGLSLSRSIVIDHGGNIEAESNPEEGSIFTMSLPITPQAEKAGEEKEIKPETQTALYHQTFRP